LSQAGLLNMSLGRTEAAFQSWTAALEKSPRAAEARFASGLMLVTYQKTANWNELEILARVTIKHKVSPQYRGKAVNPLTMLALALLEGGKQDIASSQYASAVKRLGEFVKRFRKHERHDEGMFFLATAFRGNNQHRQAIETLLSFV